MREANYSAFYVAEPFNPGSLGAYATKDFVYYNTLRMWKGSDPKFPFVDAHATTYSVRDGSDWETTLKPRLRERLRNSKNVVFFLSDRTVNSRAIREELEYGIVDQRLPVIVVYPDYVSRQELLYGGSIRQSVRDLWGKVPVFRDNMQFVPTLHVPMNKDTITLALREPGMMLATKFAPSIRRYDP